MAARRVGDDGCVISRRGRFRCASKGSGVKCVNERNDHGFKLSRQRAKGF